MYFSKTLGFVMIRGPKLLRINCDLKVPNLFQLFNGGFGACGIPGGSKVEVLSICCDKEAVDRLHPHKLGSRIAVRLAEKLQRLWDSGFLGAAFLITRAASVRRREK